MSYALRAGNKRRGVRSNQMYICICKAKTEDDIKKEGIATTAGTGCGTCLPYVESLLAELPEKGITEPLERPSGPLEEPV